MYQLKLSRYLLRQLSGSGFLGFDFEFGDYHLTRLNYYSDSETTFTSDKLQKSGSGFRYAVSLILLFD